MIHELISFLYFDYELLPKKNDKKIIIKKLHKLNHSKHKVNLDCLINNIF